MSELQEVAIICVLVAICFDIITGFANALMHGEVSSTKMREGFWHKFAIIALMALTVGLDYACDWLDFGFEPPVIEIAAVYIIVMEMSSILENICKMNPQLANNPLFKILAENINSDIDKGN